MATAGGGREAKPAEALQIEIEPHVVELEPPITIFQVVLAAGNGTWTESFGAESLLKAFLHGVEAASSMLGNAVRIPEIPRQPVERIYVREKEELPAGGS